MEQLITNSMWGGYNPLFTIITPVYNRADTLGRTIDSIVRQSVRNFEYIIVDDGSTDNIDDVVLPFVKTTDIPTLYIKKDNGGVHTARNAAIIRARGKLLINIDSDDELVENALERLKETWDSIPEDRRHEYREIVARCRDENGNEIGGLFPENINKMPWNEAVKVCEDTKGEHSGCHVTKVLKENLFPEEEGVTFITEAILWDKLFLKYKSWFINDVLRVYHSDGSDHLSTALQHPKKTIQSCRNAMFESMYMLNQWDVYRNFYSYKTILLRYCIMKRILLRHNDKYCQKWKLQAAKDRKLETLITLPAIVLSEFYEKKRM